MSCPADHHFFAACSAAVCVLLIIAAHLTGMDHLLAAPCVVNEGSPALLLFSAGKSGSVKRWKLRLAHVMKKLGVEGEGSCHVTSVITTCVLSWVRIAWL
jgi:coenzyme F420-reducing hydrogenase delta subunit